MCKTYILFQLNCPTAEGPEYDYGDRRKYSWNTRSTAPFSVQLSPAQSARRSYVELNCLSSQYDGSLGSPIDLESIDSWLLMKGEELNCPHRMKPFTLLRRRTGLTVIVAELHRTLSQGSLPRRCLKRRGCLTSER